MKADEPFLVRAREIEELGFEVVQQSAFLGGR